MATGTSTMTMPLPTLLAVGAGPVVVCTEGRWLLPASFRACDAFRVTITGPGATNVKVEASVEFHEESVHR